MNVEVNEIEVEPAKPAVYASQVVLYLTVQEAELIATLLGQTSGHGVDTYAMFDELEAAGLYPRNKFKLTTNNGGRISAINVEPMES